MHGFYHFQSRVMLRSFRKRGLRLFCFLKPYQTYIDINMSQIYNFTYSNLSSKINLKEEKLINQHVRTNAR